MTADDGRTIDGELDGPVRDVPGDVVASAWRDAIRNPPARRANLTPAPKPDLDWSTRRDRRAERAWRERTGADMVTPWSRDDDRMMRRAEDHFEAAGGRAEQLRRAPGCSTEHVAAAERYLRAAHALVVGLQRRHDTGGMSRTERERAGDALDQLTELARALPAPPKARPAPVSAAPSPLARELADVTKAQAEARLRDVLGSVGGVPTARALSELAAEIGPLVGVGLLDWETTRERLVAAAERAGVHRRIDADVERRIGLGMLKGFEKLTRADIMSVLQARDARR